MTTFGITWDDPWVLLGLLVLPMLAWRTWSLVAPGRVRVPIGDAVRALPSVKASLWWLPDALRILAVGAMVIALARPQVDGDQAITGKGVDIMVALDMSISMNAVDAERQALEKMLKDGETPMTRFEVARDILRKFITARNQDSSDRIGLVIFGQGDWLAYPPTQDHRRLIEKMQALILDSGISTQDGSCANRCTISGRGTAIGDALQKSNSLLARSDGTARVVILITDGKQEGGEYDAKKVAREMAKKAAKTPDNLADDVRVYAFSVGGGAEVFMREFNRFGRPLVDRAGRPVYRTPRAPSPTDPDLLREIADQTKGAFYDSFNAEKFRADIEDLERTVFTNVVEVPQHDVFTWPLLFGLLFLTLEWALRLTLFRGLV
ncbi:MAG: Ca-activated chloride channel family protein [Myxococcota bacterium]